MVEGLGRSLVMLAPLQWQMLSVPVVVPVSCNTAIRGRGEPQRRPMATHVNKSGGVGLCGCAMGTNSPCAPRRHRAG